MANLQTREVEAASAAEIWPRKKLAELSRETFGGGTPSTANPAFWDGDQPWTTSAMIKSDDLYLEQPQRFITREALAHSSARVAPRGSVLIGTRVGVGKAVVASIDVAINQDLIAIVVTDEITPEYLVFALKQPSIQAWFTANKRGSTIKGVPRGDLLALEIPVPSLAEQRLISAVLLAVKQAKAATENVIAATREMRRSLLAHLFTHGPVEASSEVKTMDTPIGRLPAHWHAVPFEDVLISGTQNGLYKSRSEYGSGCPIVDMTDVFRGDVLRSVSERLALSPTEISKYGLHDGDLLFARRSFKPEGAGKCQLVPSLQEPTVFSSSIIRTSPDVSKVDSSYLLYFFSSPSGRNVIGQIVRHLAVSGISGGDLKKVIVPLPPLSEQKLVAQELRAVDVKLAAEHKRQEALTTLSESLIHELMIGKRRISGTP